MRVLLVGATGFVGRSTLDELMARGVNVVAFGRSPAAVPARVSNAGLLEWHFGDMVDYDWNRIGGSIDAVICIAASLRMGTSTDDWRKVVDTNIVAFERLFRWSAYRGVGSFVFTSSAGLYRRPAESLPVPEGAPIDPRSTYLLSKLLAERLVFASDAPSGMRRWALRLSSPYGPGQALNSVLPRFVAAARAGQDLQCFGRGDRSQDFVHVEDAARAHVSCIEAVSEGVQGPINIGSGMETSMRGLATAVLATFGQPRQSIQFAAPDGSDGDRFVLDISRARALIGFQPRGLDQGLAEWRRCGG